MLTESGGVNSRSIQFLSQGDSHNIRFLLYRVDLILILMFQSSCSAALPTLPISHQQRQWNRQNHSQPNQGRDVLNNPEVLQSIVIFDANIWLSQPGAYVMINKLINIENYYVRRRIFREIVITVQSAVPAGAVEEPPLEPVLLLLHRGDLIVVAAAVREVGRK